MKLVRSMCDELNWNSLARLLGSLQTWFRTRIPRSFVCFLEEEAQIPFPCIQYLAREELTIREIAEMTVEQVADKLTRGMAMVFGVSRLSTLLKPLVCNTSVEQSRYRNYEHFYEDMQRVAAILHRIAFEKRLEMITNRAVKELELSDLSLLMSPLVTEREAMLNALENDNQSEGERSDGILSGSEDMNSQIASEEEGDEEDSTKRTTGLRSETVDSTFWENKRRHTSGVDEYTCLEEEDEHICGVTEGSLKPENHSVIAAAPSVPTSQDLKGTGAQTSVSVYSYGSPILTSGNFHQYGQISNQVTFQQEYNAVL